MRKFVVAALLAASAVPAQAEIRFEMTGKYSTGSLGSDGYYSGQAVLNGYCRFECDIFSLNGSGFSFHTNYQYDWYGLSFEYSTTYSSAFSNTFRSGYGEIDRLIPGEEFGEYGWEHAVFTKARVFEDGTEFEGDWYPSFGGINLHYVGAPEPATWAMMIGGFALAGAALRRQRYQVAFAAR